MIKVFLATPCYEGKVHVPFAISLAETVCLLRQNNIECKYEMTCSGSLLCAERNKLLMHFLASDCSHILCLDSDLGWPAQAVLAMLQKDVDFVAGCYPSRRDNLFLFRPKTQEDSSLVFDKEKGLIEMENIPAGFMLIKRYVIETLIRTFPETYFKPKVGSGEDGYCLFNTELIDGEFWGEDYVFCNYVRAAGFQIWVDPFIEFDHAGVRGVFTSVLTDKRPSDQKEGDQVNAIHGAS